jgi:hypothetical protein
MMDIFHAKVTVDECHVTQVDEILALEARVGGKLKLYYLRLC